MYKSLYGSILSFLLSKCLGMEWLGHIVGMYLTSKKLSTCFPKMCHFTFLTIAYDSFSFVISYLKYIVSLLNFCYEMVYKCNFNSISQVTNAVQHLFVCIFTILCVFFSKVQIFCPYSTSCFLITEW